MRSYSVRHCHLPGDFCFLSRSHLVSGKEYKLIYVFCYLYSHLHHLYSLLLQIVQHLRHYTEPMFQRYIVRIIFLIPVYAACSFASLLAADAAIYITTIRDWCGGHFTFL